MTVCYLFILSTRTILHGTPLGAIFSLADARGTAILSLVESENHLIFNWRPKGATAAFILVQKPSLSTPRYMMSCVEMPFVDRVSDSWRYP